MEHSRGLKLTVLVLLSVSLVIAPLSALAQWPAGNTVGASSQVADRSPRAIESIQDITLDHDGTMRGQVVDERGAAVVKARVEIRHLQKKVATTTTDENGEFAISGLRGGLHSVTADGKRTFYRLWKSGTAPPATSDAALIVADGQVQRGQFGGYRSGFGRLEYPLLDRSEVRGLLFIPAIVVGALIIMKNKPVRASS